MRNAHPVRRTVTLAPVPKSSSPTELVRMAVEAAVDQKGIDVIALDVREDSSAGESFKLRNSSRPAQGCSFADYFVIMSGTSTRHVKSLADKIEARLTAVGEKPLHINGLDSCEWVVIDYGNLVVHVFYEPARQYYGLDQFWRERGRVIPPSPELVDELRQLRTGMFG